MMIIIQASSSILPLGAISSENGFTSATPRLCSGLDKRKTELNTFWDRRIKKYDNKMFCRAVARLPAHRLEFNYFSRVSPRLDGVTLWSDENWWLPRGGRGLRQQWWNRIKMRWTTTITIITLTLNHKQSLRPLSLSVKCSYDYHRERKPKMVRLKSEESENSEVKENLKWWD